MDFGSIIGPHGVAEKRIDTAASASRDNGYFVKIEHNDWSMSVAMMKSSTKIDRACFRIMHDSIYDYAGVRIPVRLLPALGK